MGRSAFAQEYAQLAAGVDAHARGGKFEDLLEELFRQAHFQVVRNPGIARPRQTDLFARYGSDRYLIEAKWQSDPLGTDDLDSLKARLGRTEPSVIGVVLSTSGFRDAFVDELAAHRKRSILLFGEAELARILEFPDELLPLLRLKHEEFVVHGRVHQLPATPRLRRHPRPPGHLPEADVTFLGPDDTPQPYLTCGGGFGQFVFAQDLPDVDWVTAGGSGVCLDLALQVFDEDGILDLLHELRGMGWTTPRARWTIQQIATTWHGIGPRGFADTLRAWRARTAALASVHHSEQITYYDTFDGGFFTLTATLSSDPTRRATQCALSFQLTGIPLDPAPLQHLHDAFDVRGAGYFRSLGEPSVTRRHLPEPHLLQVVGRVVARDAVGDEEPEDWVTGLVVTNPYHQSRTEPPKDWPGQVEDAPLLICDLRSHHPLSDPRSEYRLFRWEQASSSDALVLRLIADW